MLGSMSLQANGFCEIRRGLPARKKKCRSPVIRRNLSTDGDCREGGNLIKQAHIYDLFSSYPEVLTVSETAKAVRCSAGFIYGLLRSDRLPCYRVGRTYRIRKNDAVICFSGSSTFSPEVGGDCLCEFFR